MTRQEAIERCGIEAVEAVERENCEMTNRVLPVGDDTEWSASVEYGYGLLTIYYMTTPDDEAKVVAHNDDWGVIDWSDRVNRYEVNK